MIDVTPRLEYDATFELPMLYPRHFLEDPFTDVARYTAEQMRAYAAQAVAADRGRMTEPPEPFSLEEAILHGDDSPKYTARDMLRAVAEERERCAKVAEGAQHLPNDGQDFASGWCSAALQIAQAIRKGPNAKGEQQ